MESDREVDFEHPELNKEYSTIAGYYYIFKIDRLDLNGKHILYMVGSGVYDNFCCGGGSCGYAIIPGLIVDWEYRKNREERPVSRVEPVKDKSLRDEITRVIKEQEKVSQVIFH